MVWFIIGLFLFLGLISGFFFLWKIPIIPRTNVNQKTASVSIIIPARNEEQSLPLLLASIHEQTLRPLEVIVVDDDSSDRTVQIAEQFKATVLSTKSHSVTPKGKSAACWLGAQAAKGDWLVFLDSDTYFVHNDALRAIASVFVTNKENGLLSIQPYHEIKQFYETLSVVLNVMVMAGLNRFSLFRDKLPHRGAFGPFLLTTRKQYMQTGGHYAILDSHMDDIELAKLYKKKKWPVNVYGGQGSIHFRMFPEGVRQLVNGWTKSLIHGAKGTHLLVHISIGLWITGSFLTAILLIRSAVPFEPEVFFIALAVYAGYCVQFRWLMNKVGSFPVWTMIIPVISITAFLVLYAWAVIQVNFLKKVKWRDREIKT
ncbi:MAG: glycosyltransferase [Alkalibacterium sp.]|nr:glycosyltransferase [Alkalibacterium sp.]